MMCLATGFTSNANDLLGITPDTQWILIGTTHGNIEVRSNKNGQLLKTLSHKDKEGFEDLVSPVSAINFRAQCTLSPDGTLLATSSGNYPITLWDTKSWKKVAQLPQPSVGYQLKFSPDGNYLAGIGIDSKAGPHRMSLWHIPTHQLITSQTIQLSFGPSYKDNLFSKVHFSESGEMLIVESKEKGKPYISIRKTKSGKTLGRFQTNKWKLAPNGKVLMMSTSSGNENKKTLSLWHFKKDRFVEIHSF